MVAALSYDAWTDHDEDLAARRAVEGSAILVAVYRRRLEIARGKALAADRALGFAIDRAEGAREELLRAAEQLEDACRLRARADLLFSSGAT